MSELQDLKKKTWSTFSQYIRLRDALRTTGALEACLCVTCGRSKPAWVLKESGERGFVRGGIQAGHFMPGRHNAILVDDRAVFGQCAYCNDYLKGNWVPYYDFMLRTYGQPLIDELKKRDKDIVSWKVYELEELRLDLTSRIVNIFTQNGLNEKGQ